MVLMRASLVRGLSAFAKRAASRAFHTTDSSMAVIVVGDKLPDAELYEDTPANKVNVSELTNNKRIVLFAVAGAFTPGCSETHLPGYLENAEKMKAGGIDEILCVSVNDPFVMAAWATQHETSGKIRMLADPKAEFVKALELSVELPSLGGLRAKRFSMVADNGVVQELNVEPDDTGLTCSLADQLKIKKEGSLKP